MRVVGGFWVVVGLVLVGMTAVTLTRVISEFSGAEGTVSPGELGMRIRLSRGYSFSGLAALVVGLPLLIVGIVRTAGTRRNGANTPAGA
ncbi:MAG TPA: hypothetical protein VMZ92_07205 [Planctomycetota bacterium]|nr:hypothetical protein [Planctomycetota bacterium]